MEVKTTPAMDVVAAPPPDGNEKPAPKPPEHVEHAEHKPSKPAPASKVRRDGSVTAAIFATVIIVLGLAALAVFAYLKQTGKL